jgi:hypothetical protein
MPTPHATTVRSADGRAPYESEPAKRAPKREVVDNYLSAAMKVLVSRGLRAVARR